MAQVVYTSHSQGEHTSIMRRSQSIMLGGAGTNLIASSLIRSLSVCHSTSSLFCCEKLNFESCINKRKHWLFISYPYWCSYWDCKSKLAFLGLLRQKVSTPCLLYITSECCDLQFDIKQKLTRETTVRHVNNSTGKNTRDQWNVQRSMCNVWKERPEDTQTPSEMRMRQLEGNFSKYCKGRNPK